MDSITIPARTDELNTVYEFVMRKLAARNCSGKTLYQLRLVIEEIFVNIASYAYAPGDGEAEIGCLVAEDPPRVVVRFMDGGAPFDPLSREEADTSPEGLMGREGGLGILLVKKLMDEVRYAYEDGKNILTVMKKL